MQGISPKAILKSHKLISNHQKVSPKIKNLNSKTKVYNNNNNAKGSFIKNPSSIINENVLYKPEQHNQIKTSQILKNKKIREQKQIMKKNLTINTNNISSSSNNKNNNNNNNNNKEIKKDLAAPIKIKNFHSAVNSGGLVSIRIPNKVNNLIKKKEIIQNNRNKTSNNFHHYPKTSFNTNQSKKNQLHKVKSANNKIQNKKPLIITSTNSKEKIGIKNEKNNINENTTPKSNLKNSKTNPLLNEENIIKKNQSRIKKEILSSDKNNIEYGKIFGLLNNEIKEITDLFKRTQSVDQQKNNHQEINFFNLQGLEEISTNLFEKQNENEDEKYEKMIDISQLENEEEEISVNRNKSQSILFSSYNSELYKNLINTNHNNYENNDIYNNNNNLSASSIRNNIIQIAKNNINFKENYKNENENDKSEINDKTECQFIDFDFNKEIGDDDSNNLINRNNNYSNVNDNILEDIDSEKTDTLIDETSNTNNVSKNIPIQEIMQKIRDE